MLGSGASVASRTMERTKDKQRQALAAAIAMVKEGWTQGAYTRNSDGNPCPPSSPHVRRVDLAQAVAVAAVDYGLEEEELRDLVTAQLARPYNRDLLFGLEHWNDQPWRTRTEVVLVLERTMRKLDSKRARGGGL